VIRANLVPLVLVLLGILAPTARAQYPDLNPKLQKGKIAIGSAMVFPPEIEFTKLGMKGPEGMTPEADKLAETLYSALSQELSLRGVKLLLNPGEPKSDVEKYALANLQAKFDTVHLQLGLRPGGVERGRYSLGDGVSTFVPAKGADGLVFLRGKAIQATPAKAAISGYRGWPHFSADVTFIDAKTGEVLAWAPLHRWGDMTKDQDARLAQTIRSSLRDIPLPVKAPK
jgi:hypothetical protein